MLEQSYNTDHTERDKVSQINGTCLWEISEREKLKWIFEALGNNTVKTADGV